MGGGGQGQGGQGGASPPSCTAGGSGGNPDLACCALPGDDGLVCLTDTQCWSDDGIVVRCDVNSQCAGACCYRAPPNAALACGETCETQTVLCEGEGDWCPNDDGCCKLGGTALFMCQDTC